MEANISRIKEIIGEHGQPSEEIFIIRKTEMTDGDLVKSVFDFNELGVEIVTTMNNIEIGEDFFFYEDLSENIINRIVSFLEKWLENEKES